MELQVGVDGEVEHQALGLGPLHEATLPVVPPGRGAPQRVREVDQIVLQLVMLLIGLVGKAGDPAVVLGVVRCRRATQVTTLQRPVERDLYGIAVQTLAAPLVVGVVGVGRQHENCVGRRAGDRPDDEECLRRCRLAGLAIGMQRDLIEARRPCRVELHRECHRPAAPGRVRIVGEWVLGNENSFASPHLDRFATNAGNRRGDARYSTAAANVDGVADCVALPIGIALDDGPSGENLIQDR